MRDALVGRPELVADEVRLALLTALAPLWRATLAGLEGADGPVAAPEEVLFVLQLAPAVAQVVREAVPGRPATLLVRAPFGFLPDDGASLRDAVLAYVAGTLEAYGDERAAAGALACAEAVHRRGGFLLVVRPSTGETRLLLAQDADLSKALDLGGIGEVVTCH